MFRYEIGARRGLSNQTPKLLSTATILLFAVALLPFKSFAQSEPSKLTFEELKAKAEAGDAAAPLDVGARDAL